MESFKLPQLDELQALRHTPVIVYSSMIGDDTVSVVYDCLRQIGQTQRLDLVLFTSGGKVTIARRLALLLREFTQYLTILVPYRARSAGTLLCLSANELILNPTAELGPIDAHIGSVGPTPPDAPGLISAEDVRAFRQMAEDWFGVNREKDRLQVLALLAQLYFPHR
jgi:ClpP class serine protease